MCLNCFIGNTILFDFQHSLKYKGKFYLLTVLMRTKAASPIILVHHPCLPTQLEGMKMIKVLGNSADWLEPVTDTSCGIFHVCFKSRLHSSVFFARLQFL